MCCDDGLNSPLCVNNEYTHEEILYADGQVGAGYTIAKTRKSQAAHGVSIVEARRKRRQVDRGEALARWAAASPPTPSCACRARPPATPCCRRREFMITDTASTPTGGTSNGQVVYGTVNNCAHGITPWGTYLTCEENWNGNFGGTGAVDTSAGHRDRQAEPPLRRERGAASATAGTPPTRAGTSAPTRTSRTCSAGWSRSTRSTRKPSPVKRTALGRFKHESAQYVVDKDDHVAFYMGDDERNEYIYKFVCSSASSTSIAAAVNRNLLDEGTLYVARFDADLTGAWLALTPGSIALDGKALRDNPNFAGANDAEVLAKILIKTRMAADAMGATMMDRPEWTGARPRLGGFNEVEVYCTLTNNNRRGTTHAIVQPGRRPHRRRLGAPAGGRRQPARRQRLRPHHPLARKRQDA